MLRPWPLVIASTVIFILFVAMPYFLFIFRVVTPGPNGIPIVSSPFPVSECVGHALGRDSWIFFFGVIGLIIVAYFVGITIGILGYARAVRSGIGKARSLIAPVLYVAFVVFLIIRPA